MIRDYDFYPPDTCACSRCRSRASCARTTRRSWPGCGTRDIVVRHLRLPGPLVQDQLYDRLERTVRRDDRARERSAFHLQLRHRHAHSVRRRCRLRGRPVARRSRPDRRRHHEVYDHNEVDKALARGWLTTGRLKGRRPGSVGWSTSSRLARSSRFSPTSIRSAPPRRLRGGLGAFLQPGLRLSW